MTEDTSDLTARMKDIWEEIERRAAKTRKAADDRREKLRRALAGPKKRFGRP